MKTKLITTKDYLLLIDEEAEIKVGDYLLEKESIINIFPDYLTDLDECDKPIAYYPLNSEAKELDLPELPNPFEDVAEIEYLKELERNNQDKNHPGYGKGLYGTPKNTWKSIFNKGYKAAQPKQFSLENMRKAIEMARKEYLSDGWSGSNMKHYYSEEEIIQSLSTQQLPKEFISEYEYVESVDELWEFQDDDSLPKRKIKTITNSEGKKVLVGTYKY